MRRRRRKQVAIKGKNADNKLNSTHSKELVRTAVSQFRSNTLLIKSFEVSFNFDTILYNYTIAGLLCVCVCVRACEIENTFTIDIIDFVCE